MTPFLEKPAKILQGPLEGKKFQWMESPLIIQGDLSRCTIEIDHDLTVTGSVSGSRISSSGGSIRLQGAVMRSKIEAFSDIFVQEASGSKFISQYGACFFEASVQHCLINAMSLIQTRPEAPVIHSSLTCSLEIDAGQVGSPESRENSVLELLPRKKTQLFELYFVYQQKLGNKEKALEKLAREIRVFSLIRDQIQDLPEEKKRELKEKAEKYQALKTEVARIREEQKRMFMTHPEEDRYNRAILVHKALYPPVKVMIDGRELSITRPENSAGFYKSGIVIRAEIEKIYNKRKVFTVGSS